jgi:hypothetical protein
MIDDGIAFVNDVPNTNNTTTGQKGDLGPTFAIPIGIVDSATMQQDRQIAQIFEIGSKRSYILAARTVGAMNIARVFYKGASLLRMLYAYYPAKLLNKASPTDMVLRDVTTKAATALPQLAVNGTILGELPDIADLPGFSNVILNLNSDLFSQPFGIVMYMKDNANRDVGAVFLEECYIQNHSMSLSANSIIVAENVSMRFERAVPIKVRVVETGAGAGASDQVKAGAVASGSVAGAALGLP